jgi:hypothetical protein
MGHAKDSLWSLDLFRCESMALQTYWVLVHGELPNWPEWSAFECPWPIDNPLLVSLQKVSIDRPFGVFWNLTRNTVLAEAAEIADTSAKRRTGLLKHDRLDSGQGLVDRPLRIGAQLLHEVRNRFGLPEPESEGTQGPQPHGALAHVSLSDCPFGSGTIGRDRGEHLHEGGRPVAD